MEEQNRVLEDLKRKCILDEDDSERLVKLVKENKDVRKQVDMEMLYTEQMNHMIERDKLEIRCSKMPI